jgi:MFS family permease
VNRNDRAVVGLVTLAHGLVHTYELSIPIFVTIWLTEFEVLDLVVTRVPVTRATVGAVVTAGYALFGLGALPGGIAVDRVGSRRLVAACLLGMAGSFLLLALGAVLGVFLFLVQPFYQATVANLRRRGAGALLRVHLPRRIRRRRARRPPRRRGSSRTRRRWCCS